MESDAVAVCCGSEIEKPTIAPPKQVEEQSCWSCRSDRIPVRRALRIAWKGSNVGKIHDAALE